MKVIFYKTLLASNEELSPAEKIVYSFLVSKSVLCLDDIFDTDGKHINVDDSLCLDDDDCYIDIFRINNCRLSAILGITRRTIITCYEHLTYYGLVDGNKILVNKQMLRGGYFELLIENKLSCELLIFYSYIKDRANSKNGILYSNRLKLSEDYNTSMMAITKLTCRLYKLNLIKKIGHNKIAVM